MPSVRLVPAQVEDAYLILKWRNDHNTRKAFGYERLISTEANEAWVAECISNKSEKLLVIETEDGQSQTHFVNRVGYIRLTTVKSEVQVEISIGRNWRGRGVATDTLKLICKEYGKAGILSAMVKIYNFSGLWAFDKAGFHEDGEVNVNGTDFIRMVYP